MTHLDQSVLETVGAVCLITMYNPALGRSTASRLRTGHSTPATCGHRWGRTEAREWRGQALHRAAGRPW